MDGYHIRNFEFVKPRFLATAVVLEIDEAEKINSKTLDYEFPDNL